MAILPPPIVDTMTDTESPPMTGWSTPTGGIGGVSSDANGAYGVNAANSAAIYNTTYTGGNHQCMFTIGTVDGGGTLGLYLGGQQAGAIGTADGYLVLARTFEDTLYIQRLDNSSATTLTTTAYTWANGYRLWARIVNGVIEARVDAGSGFPGAVDLSASDSTYTSGTQVGMFLFNDTGRAKDFAAGDLIVLKDMIGGGMVPFAR